MKSAQLGAVALVVATLVLAALATPRADSALNADNPHAADDNAGNAGVGRGGVSELSSCSASTCHGGAITKPADWTSSYSVWAASDPHSSAFLTLLSARSREIVSRLCPETADDETKFLDYLEQNCITCHATAKHIPDKPDGQALAGITCASCHGDRAWVKEHVTPAWETMPHVTKVATWEMHDTRDLQVRARLCVDCHVARPIGERGLDINHDVIAAGHPRLAFEFAGYLKALPPHWDEADDQRYRDSNQHHMRQCEFYPEVWRVGQSEAARGSLEQLGARASDQPPTVWPEFSEYSCFDCHHSIRGRPSGSPGKPSWQKWYLSMTLAGVSSRPNVALNSLKSVMDNLSADPAEVANAVDTALAAEAAAAVEDAAGLHLDWNQKTIAKRFGALAAMSLDAADWDEVTQWCVALRILVPDYQVTALGPKETKVKLQREVSCLFDLLRFGGDFNSPRGYDPDAVQESIDKTKQLLNQLLSQS